MNSLVERIAKLRREGENEARSARSREVYRWVAETFPGTLDIVKNESGEVVIDVPPEDLDILPGPSKRA